MSEKKPEVWERQPGEGNFGEKWHEEPWTMGMAVNNILYLLTRPWTIRVIPREDKSGSDWYLDPPIPEKKEKAEEDSEE